MDKPAFESALILYIAIIVVVITLIPFDFRGKPPDFSLSWCVDPTDLVTNVLLFVPVGFLYRLGLGGKGDRWAGRSLCFGLLLSIAVESAQLFIPGRYSQVLDVLTNGLGAWAGALLFVLLQGKVRDEADARFATLDLPLMHVVYLTLPLMWLSGLSLGGEPARLSLLFLLGVFGGGVLSAVMAHRFRHQGPFHRLQVSAAVLAWYLMGSLPALFTLPLAVMLIGVLVVTAVQCMTGLLLLSHPHERRFELPTLKRLLPIYGLFLLLLLWWPITTRPGAWGSGLHFGELLYKERVLMIFRFIEQLASFTLFGYILAQMRGRKAEPLSKTLGMIFLTVFLIVGIVRTIQGDMVLLFDAIDAAYLTAAGLYGGILFRLQFYSVSLPPTTELPRQTATDQRSVQYPPIPR